MAPSDSTPRSTAAAHLAVSRLAPKSPPSGHVFRIDRKRGPVWYAKYRLPDGRQVQRKLGPAWAERGRPPAGYFTKRLAEDWLRDVLGRACRGTLPGLVRTGATVADAAAEYMRYIEHDRRRKPSTVQGYRWIDAQIRPALGEMKLEDVTTEHVERWLAAIDCKPATRRKALVILHGIFQRARKVHKLSANPVSDVRASPADPSATPNDGVTMRTLTTIPQRPAERLRTSAARLLHRRSGIQTAGFTPLIDAKAASKLLGVPHAWLLAQARAGRIPHHRLGHYVRFNPDDLDHWLTENRTTPPADCRPS